MLVGKENYLWVSNVTGYMLSDTNVSICTAKSFGGAEGCYQLSSSNSWFLMFPHLQLSLSLDNLNITYLATAWVLLIQTGESWKKCFSHSVLC